LAAVERSVDAWCDGLEVALLAGTDAADQTERLSAVERRIVAAKTALAGRVEETRAYRRTHKDATGWLATTAGTSPGDAARMLRTNSRLGVV